MQKNYFNIPGYFYEWDENHGHKSHQFFYKSRNKFLVEFSGIKPGDRVIDIGCGSGVISRKIAKEIACSVVGVDLSIESVKYAKGAAKREGLKNADFVAVDVADLKSKGKFDVAIFSHTIEHIGDPAGALCAIRTVLKKGGRLIVVTPNYHSPWPLAELVSDKTMAPSWYSIREQHISRLTHKSLIKLVKEAGFEIVDDGTLYLVSLPASVFSQRLANLAFELDKKLFKLPFGMASYVKAVNS
ncbi:class I SAM-dependent methyltransferase [Candidatus Micrarchaeota archaeon]|nr:class I SAM-dependent methyltransferase [Candidatus Micrarchaeota archaeon]